ncbi:hypothetical protein IAQ61_007909, partial [Plenodomus lingam]|uniref:Predicted protein n=1 Tax=Leptosphaeria maculans (strain JN3 / isolate v23.1.3 / race Av1-4-5-6-7-8) TaxID=985895 RepID=E4ZZP2_LEPMJ
MASLLYPTAESCTASGHVQVHIVRILIESRRWLIAQPSYCMRRMRRRGDSKEATSLWAAISLSAGHHASIRRQDRLSNRQQLVIARVVLLFGVIGEMAKAEANGEWIDMREHNVEARACGMSSYSIDTRAASRGELMREI